MSDVQKIEGIKQGSQQQDIVGKLPTSLGADIRNRDIILNKEIVDKVMRDHGAFPSENFLLTTNKPDSIVRIVDPSGSKLNIIKRASNDTSFVISARRVNGHYVVTFFEPGGRRYVEAIKRKGKVVYGS